MTAAAGRRLTRQLELTRAATEARRQRITHRARTGEVDLPPALLGRIVTIPYYPLAPDVLGRITRLKLGSIVKRVKSGHNATMSYADAVVEHIVSQCNDPDSGGRMIDNIITNSILPDLSRAILSRAVTGEEFREVTVDVADGEDGGKAFTYAFA